MDAQRTFLQLAPSLSEREYLQTVFKEMTRLPAAAALFDARSPVWMLTPSAEGARQLLQFFRTGGDAAPALRFGQPDTRFLGDLYQDLNENVRKRYALLQTPDFIEAFILDRTLEPAIEKFGLDDADLIDPTCGSGHFLLGAFDRFFDHVQRQKPALGAPQAAAEALSKVYGADINPYAVAIAKFRLTLSYLEKAGFTKLSQAPKLPLHVAVADSLLYNPQHAQKELFHQDGVDAADWERRAFDFEDEREAREVLHRQYAAVVGNPPYITVKDKALRDRYRALYPSASGKYSLSVPFCERIFQLARDGGRTGQITANSFMKREFGKKLIEEYFETVDLDLIVNTSGAYIPGHGTPTVLLFGSHQAPQSGEVLAVLAKRGEPTTPEDPTKGLVWTSIAGHFDDVGFEDDYISVARLERKGLYSHPWSLAGGGASELKAHLEDASTTTLGQMVDDIGFASFTGLDDAFIIPVATARTRDLGTEIVRPMVIGECVRDWTADPAEVAITPYHPDTQAALPLDATARWGRFLWRFRTVANNVSSFGGKTREQEGQDWWTWYRWQPERYKADFRITFAFVATHNHFVLDRGGKVFKQSAPIIKLPETATEEDHLALLAYLNSSTACFWMKQVCHPKGVATRDAMTPENNRYEFAGTAMLPLPVPPGLSSHDPLLVLAKQMEALASERDDCRPATVIATENRWSDSESLTAALAKAEHREQEIFERMVATQEEIDWEVYRLFGLVDAPSVDASAGCAPEQRPFMWEGGKPAHPLPGALADAYAKRHEATKAHASLAAIENPTMKRLWRGVSGASDRYGTTVEDEARLAAQDWLVDQLEQSAATASEVTQLRDFANAARGDRLAAAMSLAEVKLENLLDDEAVPFLTALTYSPSGLEKRREWERVWELQRREDGEESVEIPVPPKYSQGSRGKATDFADTRFWRLRGKLDVPKERFISYPGCESDEDGEPVYGWAGWDHTQRAQALVALYQDRKTREGWEADRLTPMLAGLLELLPWLKQWHDEPMPDFDTTFFEAYDAFLENELRELSLTRDDLTAWRPAEKKKGRRKKK